MCDAAYFCNNPMPACHCLPRVGYGEEERARARIGGCISIILQNAMPGATCRLSLRSPRALSSLYAPLIFDNAARFISIRARPA